MKIVAVVQARMGSSRFPGKVMKKIKNEPLIGLLLKRLKLSKKITNIVVATSNNKNNIPLIEYLKDNKYDFFQGSENDVLDRYAKAANSFSADIILRITGDCPLIDPHMIDETIEIFLKKKFDYLTNTNPPSFPDGLDIEIMNLHELNTANQESKNRFDREHVTPFIKRKKNIKIFNYKNSENLSNLRWTVDEVEDFEVVENIFNHFFPRIDFSWKEVFNLYKTKPEIFEKNLKIKRNEGDKMSNGQKFWKRAKKVIPGGNMLLSKRPEMFAPDLWPSYFEKSKGCKVWDLDGNRFIDMSIMGIGTNILGYGNKEVDKSVEQVLKKGNMSSLNCPEEVLLAEKLVDINPWSHMVKFARSGGEANAIAIRIARGASGKDNVAICGYHGWHDWYLSANLSSQSNLNDHLLPGLETNGVPKNLKNTSFPFEYNNYEYLEKLVNERDIGCIKMEVVRNIEPKNNFLQKVRDLATRKGIVLIFDECTSGFRETFGGIYKKYNVEPDMAMFGKALGNGYAITAVVGKMEVMEAAQSSFLSSTFWTERIGPSAALKTLEIMEKTKSWNKISQIGREIKKKWALISKENNLEVEISGISALPSFSFKSLNNLKYKTFITQEMLKKGFLAANSVYVCVEHDKKTIDQYIFELSKIFKKIKEFEDGKEINDYLEGPVCHSGFSRLN